MNFLNKVLTHLQIGNNKIIYVSVHSVLVKHTYNYTVSNILKMWTEMR